MNRKTDVKLPLREKIGYTGASISMCIMLMFVPSFITVYYTDVVGLSAAAVGMVILVCKITDGVTDIIMGVIIDRTHSRWGKARPWILAGGIGSAVSLFLLFSSPESFSAAAAIAFCAATYFLVCPFFGTMISVAQTSVIPMITEDEKQRTILGLIHSFSLIAVTIFVTMVTPIWLSAIGENRKNYRTVAFVYMVVSIFCACVAFALLREHTTEKEEKKETQLSLRETFGTVLKNRDFVFLALGSIFYNTSLVSGSTTYYAKYILGDLSYTALFSLCMGASYFLLFFSLKFREHFSIRSMLVTGFLISALGCVVLWFANDNLIVLAVGVMLKGVGVLPVMAYSAPLTGAISDEAGRSMGKRMDGVIFSGFSMGGKVGTGLGTALVGWVLGWAGYQGTAVRQSGKALFGIRVSNSWLPLVFCILAAVCFGCIHVEKETK